MRWLPLLGLVMLTPTRVSVQQDSVYVRMKIAYCYSSYSVMSEDAAVTADVRARAKASVDSLFPRYQLALEASKGTLAETVLGAEAAKARTAKSRLSTAEWFMIQETCDSMVRSEDSTDH